MRTDGRTDVIKEELDYRDAPHLVISTTWKLTSLKSLYLIQSIGSKTIFQVLQDQNIPKVRITYV